MPVVDLAAGRIVVDPPIGLLEEGLLEEDAAGESPQETPAAGEEEKEQA